MFTVETVNNELSRLRARAAVLADRLAGRRGLLRHVDRVVQGGRAAWRADWRFKNPFAGDPPESEWRALNRRRDALQHGIDVDVRRMHDVHALIRQRALGRSALNRQRAQVMRGLGDRLPTDVIRYGIAEYLR